MHFLILGYHVIVTYEPLTTFLKGSNLLPGKQIHFFLNGENDHNYQNII